MGPFQAASLGVHRHALICLKIFSVTLHVISGFKRRRWLLSSLVIPQLYYWVSPRIRVLETLIKTVTR